MRGKPDNLVEGDETVHFQLAANSAAYVVGSPNSGDVTIIDGPPAPTITLSVIDGVANEAGTDDAIVRFTRTGGDPTAAVNVQYTNAGTAEYLTDYFYPNDSNHSLLIPVGQSTADLIVRGKPDTLIEGDETVHLSISPNPAYQLGTPDSADVTILDLNHAPVLTSANDFPTITEDDGFYGGLGQVGRFPGELLNTFYSDADQTNNPGSVQGLAIVGQDGGTGTWVYTDLDFQSHPVGPVSSTSALLVLSNRQISFIPDGQNGTAASLIVRAHGTPPISIRRLPGSTLR